MEHGGEVIEWRVAMSLGVRSGRTWGPDALGGLLGRSCLGCARPWRPGTQWRSCDDRLEQAPAPQDGRLAVESFAFVGNVPFASQAQRGLPGIQGEARRPTQQAANNAVHQLASLR